MESGNVQEESGRRAWNILSNSNATHLPSDASFFSSSLPVLPRDKSSTQASTSDVENVKFREDGEACLTENLLPHDDDMLFSGTMDDFDLSRLPCNIDDMEEYDVFGSGGGMELENDSLDRLTSNISKMSVSNGMLPNSVPHYSMGTVAGEHPYGEHPSRTLFVRNISSNVEDSELRSLFEQYGDIRTLYTECKHRGFVMISYYDIRAAKTAMRALQNKPLRRRKLDIHFSIPKDNPSDKDVNQGTLVVFNLDPSVSNDDLRIIFGAYGEVKEIRETPHKRHHKFIEFYDVRAAEAALKSLNRSDIAGKRIKLEPSRPGGTRRNLMLHMNMELEQEDHRAFRHPVGSPVISPPGNWGSVSDDHSPSQIMSRTPVFHNISLVSGNHLPGLASLLYSQTSHPTKISPIGAKPSFLSHSLPEPRLNQFHGSAPVETLSGPQFLWGSPQIYTDHVNSSPWSSTSSTKARGFSYSNQQSSFSGAFQGHQRVGSASPVAPLERRFGFFADMADSSLRDGPFGASLFPVRRNFNDVMPSSSIGLFPLMSPINSDSLMERSRGKNTANLVDMKKQFHLDLQKIKSGEDLRTTLMIKNIPNKYTSKMLLSTIDEKHQGTYDFLYLPIDFKNKCNVGYAFINMLTPASIIPFYEAFNGKKWEKFNSEKVASLAYARIQGKAALVSHFQNSSLMNEDKRCRPILLEGSDPAPSTINEPENG